MNKESLKHYAEMVNAMAEGKTLQYRVFNKDVTWEDWTQGYPPTFYDNTIENIRIKPNPYPQTARFYRAYDGEIKCHIFNNTYEDDYIHLNWVSDTFVVGVYK